MRLHKPTEPFEYILLTILGLIISAFTILALIPTETASPAPCIAPIVGSLVGVGLILLNDKQKQLPMWLLGGSVGLVLFGSIWAGMGFFTPATDLVMSGLICYGPGLFIMLFGAGSYLWQLRQAVYEEATAEAVYATPTQTVNSPTIQGYQQKLERVRLYRQQINTFMVQLDRPQLIDQLKDITQEFERWEIYTTQLIERLIRFEQDYLTQQDLVSVPQAIAKLETQLNEETNATLHQDMFDTLVQLRQHQIQLDKVTKLMQRTELDVDEMLAMMGTIYSQLQILAASDIDNTRAQRLSHQIHEEANKLNDLLLSIEEVYDMNKGV